MKLENLSKFLDPANLQMQARRQQRIADSRVISYKKSLRQKLMDTESTEDAVAVAVEALQNEEPETVLTAVVEVLGDVVSDLSQEVADSLKIIKGLKNSRPSNSKKLRKADAVYKHRFKSKIKDTESTEEATEIAKAALDEVDPESVVETVIEVLAEVIDDLEGELIEE